MGSRGGMNGSYLATLGGQRGHRPGVCGVAGAVKEITQDNSGNLVL